MPVIPEMDEFVNWDNADPALGLGTDLTGMTSQPLSGGMVPNDFDLILENVEGDDFSFWALEHYNASNIPGFDGPSADPLTLKEPLSVEAFEWYTPDSPCLHCQQGGYQCKRIREGRYKGYCTSCIALRCQCSFGFDDPATTLEFAAFPSNPWPTVGDHPRVIEEDAVAPPTLQSSSASASDLAGLTSPTSAEPSLSSKNGPKIGARFSRESVKILKNWVSTHGKHPYPTDEEKEMLQKQTGLTKTQINNYLANARRRGKIIAPRSTSPNVRGGWSSPIDIPQRRGTPASFENMNPLQRWQHSPPENEPASVTAIARAVVTASSSSAVSSGLNSPHSFNYTDDGSGKSLCNQSSASSLGTSQSSGNSFASAFSHASRGSFGSMGSFQRGRRRRRRKPTPKRPEEVGNSLTTPLKTFQCTFCTETFRTKHDWQRHEKSLHLSLERWVCAPDGPRGLNPETNQASCVFCGEANPNDAHVEAHNHSACQERSLEERTFYRKDHLRQHLKLVHGVKFISWSMEPWKVATPEIRSRCGFCGIVMDTWTIRVDHLAEHFKTGNTMADWKGDWGFEAPVLEMVENSIPPYLIHDERNSPFPYEAASSPAETPRNAYELIKLELAFWIQDYQDSHKTDPTDDEVQLEACRIIYGAEVLSSSSLSSRPSWLRDLIMSSDQIAMQAQLRPIRSANDSRMAQLRINGKDNIFDDDALEKELQEYVKARSFLGLTAIDDELQVEACNIIGRMEESSGNPSDEVANFLLRLIYRSTAWLAAFRQRALLPRMEDMADVGRRPKDSRVIDSTIHNYSRLEAELAEYVKTQRLLGVEPTDAGLQRQARIIIYEFDDGWNQTAADNSDWLTAFKQRHLRTPGSQGSSPIDNWPLTFESIAQQKQQQQLQQQQLLQQQKQQQQQNIAPVSMSMSMPLGAAVSGGLASLLATSSVNKGKSAVRSSNPVKVGNFFINDANCYRRLASELTRFVASTMSPNNPNSHVPSDEELQHQARWILYDEDDPWNQTAADNAEWLRRFKRDVGILPEDSLPGLPPGRGWNISQGGTGFAPPYAIPNPKAAVLPIATGPSVPIAQPESGRVFEADSATANKYLASLTTRLEPPATVFCSRELEAGLLSFVGANLVESNRMPDDAALQARAREIQGTDKTAADDAVLLAKFKELVKEKLGAHTPSGTVDSNEATAAPVPPVDADILGNTTMGGMSEVELNSILQDMDFDLTNPVGDLDLDIDLSSA